MRLHSLASLSVVVSFCWLEVASAQTPGVLYTWPGTGDTREWAAEGTLNTATLANTTQGVLTVTEMGYVDPIDPDIVVNGGAIVIRDGFNRRIDTSTNLGGLDLWGLEAVEIDLEHDNPGTVNVQFFMQVTPEFTYLWAGNNGTRNGPDFSLGPGVHTLRFPLDLLTPAQQSYIRTIGLSVRDHTALGNLTWNVFELRSTGTSPPFRDLATHDAGTSDNGLNGAFVNFENAAVQGNDGGQNQIGLSHDPSGPGSLKWTDLGTKGVTGTPSGAAITWGNGTLFDGNSFNERLSDFSNYDRMIIRMSATDPLNAGGELGVQGFFQTGSFTFQVAGGSDFFQNLPIDGQYHDLVYPLASVTNRENTQVFGVNLFSHTNDLGINVDLVRFEEVAGVPGDYNGNGTVDAADYVLWRSGGPLQNEVATLGAVTQEDYDEWRARFGNASGSATGDALTTVPEPASAFIALLAAAAGLILVRRHA